MLDNWQQRPLRWQANTTVGGYEHEPMCCSPAFDCPRSLPVWSSGGLTAVPNDVGLRDPTEGGDVGHPNHPMGVGMALGLFKADL